MEDDQYGLPDLRQFMAGTVHYPVIPENTEQLSGYRDLMTPPQQQYETIMMGEIFSRGSLVEFDDRGRGRTSIAATNTSAANTCITTTSSGGGGGGSGVFKLGLGLEMDEGGNNSRWPRQETLTLLGIRSRLDYKFKEGAIQKGPLWDDVSRIMAEENGYQRSGKKCREKFENLYKYYKKTKESKASRQDGKHYRFFHQLEALYGSETTHYYSSETNFVGTTTSLPYHTTNNDTATINRSEALRDEKHCESLSFTNPSEFETSSSENNDDADHDLSSIAFKMNHNDYSMEKIKRMSENHQCFKRARKSWEARSKDFVDSKMRRLIETQENWMEKMLKTMEAREQERMCREEEWKKQDAARFDREQKFWANERAWLEARDASFMEVLKKLNGKELAELASPIEQICLGNHRNNLDQFVNDIPVVNSTSSNINRWPEFEISRSLIHLRTGMDSRLENGRQKELREEISAKMAYLGYDRSAISCKEKWESLGLYGNKSLDNDRNKPEENLRNINYFQLLDSFQDKKIIEQEPESTTAGVPLINNVHYPSNLVMNNEVRDSCFRVQAADGEHLWEKYGLKPRKERNQQG